MVVNSAPDPAHVRIGMKLRLTTFPIGGVGINDIGILGAGNLLGGAANFGQNLQKQIGQTGAPVYNVANARSCRTSTRSAGWRPTTRMSMPVCRRKTSTWSNCTNAS
ncbi:hypothetical protein [Nonomuraea insulae]|uniref:Uncharacterized protein n=1 Tax=Nonomuraea insulae TaxID=1616787 RepID=A0ABW1D325_9ACTN